MAVAVVTSQGDFTATESTMHKILSQMTLTDKKSGAVVPLYRSYAIVGWDGVVSQTYILAALKGKIGDADIHWGGMEINEKIHFSMMNPTSFSVDQKWHADNITLLGPKETELQWDGLNVMAKGIVNKNKVDMDMSMTVGAIRFMDNDKKETTKKSQLDIKPFSLMIKSARTIVDPVATGTGEISLPSLTILTKDKDLGLREITISKGVLTANLTQTPKKQYDYDAKIALENFHVAHPDFTITDSTWDFSAKNLTEKGVTLLQALDEQQASDMDQKSQLAHASGVILALIDKDTVLSSKLNLSTSVGHATAIAKSMWSGNASPQSVGELLAGIQAHLDVRLSETMFNAIRDHVIQNIVDKKMQTISSTVASSLAAKTPASDVTDNSQQAISAPEDMRKQMTNQMRDQLNEMMKKGYIARDQSDYVISVRYEKGVLTVNGLIVSGASKPAAEGTQGTLLSPDAAMPPIAVVPDSAPAMP